MARYALPVGQLRDGAVRGMHVRKALTAGLAVTLMPALAALAIVRKQKRIREQSSDVVEAISRLQRENLAQWEETSGVLDTYHLPIGQD